MRIKAAVTREQGAPYVIEEVELAPPKKDEMLVRIVASGVNQLRSPQNATVVITHYQRLLDYIVPDYVHVLFEGRIVKTGPKELAMELEEKGYEWIKKELEQ